MKILVASVVTTAIALLGNCSYALECPKFPEQAKKDWEININAEVAKIGPLKGTELKTTTRTITQDLLSKLPDAGRVYLEQMMFATYCTTLRDDKTLTETERSKRLKEYIGEVKKVTQAKNSAKQKGKRVPAKKELSADSLRPTPVESSNKYGISNEMYIKLLDITGGQTKTIEALIGKLNEKEITIKERDEKINLLTKEYAMLKASYETQVNLKTLSKQDRENLAIAKEKLINGDLEGANAMLSGISMQIQLGQITASSTSTSKPASEQIIKDLPEQHLETHGNQSPIIQDNKGTVIINGSPRSPLNNQERK